MQNAELVYNSFNHKSGSKWSADFHIWMSAVQTMDHGFRKCTFTVIFHESYAKVLEAVFRILHFPQNRYQ